MTERTEQFLAELNEAILLGTLTERQKLILRHMIEYAKTQDCGMKHEDLDKLKESLT